MKNVNDTASHPCYVAGGAIRDVYSVYDSEISNDVYAEWNTPVGQCNIS